ncbi:U3 small nucleolar RNA-associated protein 14 homolog A-like [Perognathus longimembris pacificus]|uniref:U3 small nucleolar RNA-associated protein 14 homolog A-like n=1 Tax=Perognathus longimembris pacificus TaxID=214514 RepID=UPI00201906AB|nr:U3 small nucleolar RNA-associated protein 14 homolog A-like [Perognathus longimembris pacificus]
MNTTWAAEDLLALSQQEALEYLPNNYLVSASEDEWDSDGERKHQKFLDTITSLIGTSRWKLTERSETSLNVSEFNVSSEGSGEKLVLSDLLGPAKTSSSLDAVKKQLYRVKSKKTLELPLNKKEVKRIHREVAFNQTSQTLSKWDPVVGKNRQAEQLVFPLVKEPSAYGPIEYVFSGWKVTTPLEQEVFNLLHKNKQPMTDPVLTPMEKASLKAMSLEEAKMRQSELQKARALQSFYEARARREKKIKSKKYHRIVKKGKAKKALKEFEQQWKVNPNAALEELEKIEKARMMERMNLKHQNSGKWAKSKAIMAKYNLEVRQAMQEQLAKNKELTQKLQVISESEEEEGNTEEKEPLTSDVMHEVQMNGDVTNPWMFKECDIDAKEDQTPKFSEVKENQRPVAEKEILSRDHEEKHSLRKPSELDHDEEPLGSQEMKDSNSQEVLSELRVLSQKCNKKSHHSRKQKVNSVGTVVLVQRAEPSPGEEQPLLLQRSERVQTLEALEHLVEEPLSPVLGRGQMKRNLCNKPDVSKGKKKKEQIIDLQNLLTTKSPSVKSLAVPTAVELEDEVERDQKQMITEAFAGDDVIREFLKEKKEMAEANKPRDIDLILPGWGEWSSVGLRPSAKKRRRFLIKAPEDPPRKDKNLPNAVISEKHNIQAAAHQVQVLPYPFTHHQQFEQTIQNPVGSMWNTQRAFQKLTAPRVVTKPGHVIKPIKAEDVGYCSSQSDLSVIQNNTKQLSRHYQK